jgi:hypothetical protein
MQNALSAPMNDRELVEAILRDPVLRQACEMMTQIVISHRRNGQDKIECEFNLQGRQVFASVRERFASVVVMKDR